MLWEVDGEPVTLSAALDASPWSTDAPTWRDAVAASRARRCVTAVPGAAWTYTLRTGDDDAADSQAGSSGKATVATGSSASLVGRQRELNALISGLDIAAVGNGQLFLLEGEPGIGKTHLARAISEEARARGSAVVWGRCWEEGGAPAYWPWTQVLRAVLRRRGPLTGQDVDVTRWRRLVSIVPEVDELIRGDRVGDDSDAPPVQFALFDAVATLLDESVDAPALVVVLDDLHAADQDSLRLLQFVARDLAQRRLLMVGTYRGDDAARNGTDVVLTKLAREGRVLPLRGLTESQVGTLVHQIAGEPANDSVVRSVHRATNGNPLYVDSIAHLLVAEEQLNPVEAVTGEPGSVGSLPLPLSMREATRSRLTYLDDESRSVLRVAAVVGRTFALPVLGMVVDRTQHLLLDVLDEAVNRGNDPASSTVANTFTFEHMLVRDALYRELEPSRRAELHWRVGTALEQVHRRRPRPAPRRARPPLPAGGRAGPCRRPGDRVLESGRSTGDRPDRLRRGRDALTVERSTRSCPGASDPVRRCDLFLALGRARTRGGDTVAGRATLPRGGDAGPPRRARATAWRGGDRLRRCHRLSLQRPSRRDARRPSRGGDQRPSARRLADPRSPAGAPVRRAVLVRPRRPSLRAQRGSGGDGPTAGRSVDAGDGDPQSPLRPMGPGQLRAAPRRRHPEPGPGVRGERARDSPSRRAAGGSPISSRTATWPPPTASSTPMPSWPSACTSRSCSPTPRSSGPCGRSCKVASVTVRRSPPMPDRRPTELATRWPAAVYGSQMLPVWWQCAGQRPARRLLAHRTAFGAATRRDDECDGADPRRAG